MNRKEILELLVSKDKDELRPHMKNAWHRNGKSFSTNGFCIFKVDGSYGVNLDTTAHYFPPVDNFNFRSLEDADSGKRIDMSVVRTFTRPCSHCKDGVSFFEKIKCTACDGDGGMGYPYCGSETDCDICNGSGYTKRATSKPIECDECFGTGCYWNGAQDAFPAYNLLLNPSFLIFLHNNLGGLEFLPDIKAWKGDSDGCVGFRFNGGVGAVMGIADNRK